MYQIISRNNHGRTTHHLFNIRFRQLESVEVLFSSARKELRKKTVHCRRLNDQTGDNTNL